MERKNYYLLSLIIGLSSSVLFSQSSADFWTVGISSGLNSPIGKFSNGNVSAGFEPSDITGGPDRFPYSSIPLRFENDGFAGTGFFVNLNLQSKSVKGFAIGLDAGYSFNGHSSKWDNLKKIAQEYETYSFDFEDRINYRSLKLDPYQLFYLSLKLNKSIRINRYTISFGSGIGYSYLLYPYYERRWYGTNSALNPPVTTYDEPWLILTNSLQPGIRNPRSIQYTGAIQLNREIKEGLFIGLDLVYFKVPSLDFITGHLYNYETPSGEIQLWHDYRDIQDRIPYEVLQIGVSLKYALGG